MTTGRREKDMRQKFADVGSNVQQGSQVDKSQGAARAISSFIDPGLNWKDLDWFKSITKMPLVLKVRVGDKSGLLRLSLTMAWRGVACRVCNAGKTPFWLPRQV